MLERFLILGLLAAFSTSVSHESATRVTLSSAKARARYGLENLPCVVFGWNSDHNVMRVPITMGGRAYTYQLDTGADEVIPYGKSSHNDWEEKHQGVRIPDVTFAGAHFPAIVGYPFPQVPDIDLQGTVGLDLLMSKIFVIDFPAQKTCLFSRADLPDALDAAADWSPAEVRHGKLFIRTEFNGRPLDGIFYDTGSSPSTLVVDRQLWQRLTRKARPSSGGDFVSWGVEQHSVGAHAKGILKIGAHTFADPLVDTNTSKPNGFRSNDQAQGLLGNALFLKSIVVLDLGAHARFGLINVSD